MYDTLQLNDMLVPELHDIAEQLTISNFKKLEKQDLIDKILARQNSMTASAKNDGEEKPKRKRTIKAAATNTGAEIVAATEKPKEDIKPEPKAAPKHQDFKTHKKAEHATDRQGR